MGLAQAHPNDMGNIQYSQKFSLDKISPIASPGTFVLQKINIHGINFHQYAKGCHMLYVIINTGQNIRRTTFSPTRPGGEIGENFLLAKISGYTVTYHHNNYYKDWT